MDDHAPSVSTARDGSSPESERGRRLAHRIDQLCDEARAVIEDLLDCWLGPDADAC